MVPADDAQLTAGDIMTPNPVSVTEVESVASAWELLARGDFHHLPVVRGGRCVGMLDDRVLLATWRPGSPNRRSRQTVGDLPLRSTPSVTPGTTVRVIASLLDDGDLDAVTVADDDDRMVGVVTASDLIRVLAGRER